MNKPALSDCAEVVEPLFISICLSLTCNLSTLNSPNVPLTCKLLNTIKSPLLSDIAVLNDAVYAFIDEEKLLCEGANSLINVPSTVPLTSILLSE